MPKAQVVLLVDALPKPEPERNEAHHNQELFFEVGGYPRAITFVIIQVFDIAAKKDHDGSDVFQGLSHGCNDIGKEKVSESYCSKRRNKNLQKSVT